MDATEGEWLAESNARFELEARAVVGALNALPGGTLMRVTALLLRNAAEAALSTEETSPTAPLVVVSWTATPTQATLHIRDNGPGLINPANLFVPFYTTKPEGSGIGLVLAQQIATAHKGSITLSNNPDAPGCTAEFRLPAELEP